jgi:4-methylaminobutanoate oxidase (formaldehyde-forming)
LTLISIFNIVYFSLNILDGKVDEYDITGMNLDRFQRFHGNLKYRGSRVVESLGMVYKLHYPNRSMLTARGNKRSPIHSRLEDSVRCAYFKDVSGWESPLFYGVNTILSEGEEDSILQTEEELSWGRERWFERWREEHLSCREGVVRNFSR